MGNFQDESGFENYKDALKWVEGAPPTEPTNAQIRSLKQLLKMLKSQFTIEKVGGHRDFAVQGGETVCPEIHYTEFLKMRGLLCYEGMDLID